jgi:FkbM family methyltransferase
MPTSANVAARLRKRLSDAHAISRVGATPLESARIGLVYAVMPIKSRCPRLHERWITLRVARNGVRGTVVVSDASELLTLKELLVEDEYELPATAAPKVILDLGANVGVATLLLRAHYPAATVVAVEPDPATFRKLVRNVSADPRVVTINAAIAPRRGRSSFAVDEMSWSGKLTDDDNAVGIRVETTTLDQLVEDFGLQQGDMVKMDIEGAEHDVIPAARCLDRFSVLIGEVHPIADGAAERLLAALESEGWRHIRPMKRWSFALRRDYPVPPT